MTFAIFLVNLSLSTTAGYFPAQDEKKSAEEERDELKKKLAKIEKENKALELKILDENLKGEKKRS